MISLLWPAGRPTTTPPDRWAADLALDTLVNALALSSRYAGTVRTTLTALCTDLPTIAYRQALLADLLERPALAAALEALLPALATAAASGASHWADEAAIFQVAGRVAELETYIGAVTELHSALETVETPFTAAGWQGLQADLAATTSSAEFQALAAELPKLRARLEQAGSVTLGINLDAQLHPESAALLSVNAERFSGPRSLLGRLLGERNGSAGITPLRQANERQPFGPDRRLFLDLSELLSEVTRPIADALTRYAKINGTALAPLEQELAFYLGAARLITALQAEGYAYCRPDIVAPDERLISADGLYNLDLALRLRNRPPRTDGPPAIVANDVRFDAAGRIFVLTGPNRGGKTTYTRAIGQALALAQAGLPVPATSARLSPVDAMYTLFPAAEQAQIGMGRLDEEAAQLAAIFRKATAQSLVLLNEPLGSTSPREATLIARDVLCGLRMLGARALLVTHLHELASEAAGLNDTVAGASRIACLIAGAATNDGGDAERTYRILPGTPDGRSYAVDIALAHGLELRQIERTLRERGLE